MGVKPRCNGFQVLTRRLRNYQKVLETLQLMVESWNRSWLPCFNKTIVSIHIRRPNLIIVEIPVGGDGIEAHSHPAVDIRKDPSTVVLPLCLDFLWTPPCKRDIT